MHCALAEVGNLRKWLATNVWTSGKHLFSYYYYIITDSPTLQRLDKMVYMVVEKHTPDLLYLKRSPGVRSWSLFVGIVSVGLAAAYYSSDIVLHGQTDENLEERGGVQLFICGWVKDLGIRTLQDSVLWKLFYITGCIFVALQNMEEWEEATFDKPNGVIELKSFSLYAVILTLWKKGKEKVVLDLRHLRDISVQEEKVRYLGTGYVLVLRMATGFSHPLTQNATLSGRSDVEALSALLKRFLEIEALQQNLTQEGEDEDCDEDDDEFEQLGMDGDDESSESSDHQEQPTQ